MRYFSLFSGIGAFEKALSLEYVPFVTVLQAIIKKLKKTGIL